MPLPGIQSPLLSELAFDQQSRVLFACGGALMRVDDDSDYFNEFISWNLPTCDVRKHLFTPAKDSIADFALRPGGKELATKSTDLITVWTADFKQLRTMKNEFLGGPISYSPNGAHYVAPAENKLKIHDSNSGKVTATIKFDKSDYTSAQAATFLPNGTQLLVVASVINSRGQTSGKLLLIERKPGAVLKSVKLDLEPSRSRIVVDPRGRWACIAGKLKNRGCLLFWNLSTWKVINQQGAHGRSVDSLACSPTGDQLASTGADHEIRIWDTATGKSLQKIESMTHSDSSAAVAWSPDGNYLAHASGGVFPNGGVFLYQRQDTSWKLISEGQLPAKKKAPIKKTTNKKTSASKQAKPIDKKGAHDTKKWFRSYLKDNSATKPMATAQIISAWEEKNQIKLPKQYIQFVTTVGRHLFVDMFGEESYNVRIVGPKQLDQKSYRRDDIESPNEEQEPDGLMFAVAINGDCLCFDLRPRGENKPVFHFDHEMETFQPFAIDFASAIWRLTKRE
jgi:SMI1 / KNR4 family (SUKH-1)/WD domain, G-beta repeat